jgi:hypothetical protein
VGLALEKHHEENPLVPIEVRHGRQRRSCHGAVEAAMSGNDVKTVWRISPHMRARLDNRVRFRNAEMKMRFRTARRLAAVAPQSAFHNPLIIRGTD